MKNLRKPFAVLLLSCVLTLSARAGNMYTGITEPPPPPPGNAETTNTQNSSEESSGETTTVDPVTATVVVLLQNLAALF